MINRQLSLLILCSMLSACWGGNQGIYIDSSELPPLKVPENLDRPQTGTALFVPGVSAPELAGLRDAAKPPLVLSSEQAQLSDITVGYGDGALYLLIKDSQSSVHRRLGFTLNRGAMRLTEEQPGGLMYRFYFQQPAETLPKKGFFGGLWDVMLFWSDPDATSFSGQYEVRISPDNNNPAHSRVYLYDDDGKAAASDRADMIFEILQARLG